MDVDPAAIFAAAERGDVGAVDEALRGGAEIDSRAESGATPLIAAVVAQQAEVAAHLLVRPRQRHPHRDTHFEPSCDESNGIL